MLVHLVSILLLILYNRVSATNDCFGWPLFGNYTLRSRHNPYFKKLNLGERILRHNLGCPIISYFPIIRGKI